MILAPCFDSIILPQKQDTMPTTYVTSTQKRIPAAFLPVGSPTFRQKQLDIIPVSPEDKPMKKTIEVRV